MVLLPLLAVLAAAPAAPINLAVTEKGFEPARIEVKAGTPIELLVTRKTDDTCARTLVIADANVKQKLPLNEPVTVEFTPSKTGELTYTCGMNMVTGILVVN